MMSLDKKKLEPFVERSKELPDIFSLKIHRKIEQFLNGVMPELTPYEHKAIENYLPHEVWSKFNQLTDEVISEIKWNLVNIPTEDQKKDYLEHLKDILSPITYSLTRATWFDEIDKMDPDFAVKLQLEQNQIASFRLLYDLLWRSNRYYYTMYDKVERFVQGLLPASDKKKPLAAHFEALKKIHGQKSHDGMISLSDQPGVIPKIKDNSELTNRETLLILKYKHEARLIPYPKAKDQKAVSNGLYKKYYTVFSNNKSVYKSATREELQNIIPFLSDFSGAQKAAINDLTILD